MTQHQKNILVHSKGVRRTVLFEGKKINCKLVNIPRPGKCPIGKYNPGGLMAHLLEFQDGSKEYVWIGFIK